jgi:hypothetical protein
VPLRPPLPISITLSPAQVDEVLRSASRSRASSLASLISSALAEGTNGRLPAHDLDECDRRLSRSLLRGLAILACFTAERPERGILDLARELSMSASTTHRYVLTLLETGLLERSPISRRYRLPRQVAAPRADGSHSPQE